MQKKRRAGTLFYAQNSLVLLAIPAVTLWLFVLVIALVQSARGLVSPRDAALSGVLLAATSTLGCWIGLQQISFFPDHLCSVVGFFKKRVRYASIAAISLVDLKKELWASHENKISVRLECE